MSGIFDIKRDRPAKRIQEALYAEARIRADRTFIEWSSKEFEAVLDATNKERQRVGKGPVDPEDVRRAEQMALGHVDYALKWPLYCEELVYKD